VNYQPYNKQCPSAYGLAGNRLPGFRQYTYAAGSIFQSSVTSEIK